MIVWQTEVCVWEREREREREREEQNGLTVGKRRKDDIRHDKKNIFLSARGLGLKEQAVLDVANVLKLYKLII